MRIGQILVAAGLAALLVLPAGAEDKKGAGLLDKTMKTLDGKPVNLAEKYKGKVLLVVNVASKCGATPQYEQLQDLQEKYKGKDFAVIGFPCNQFGAQEPGSAAEIQEFCKANYGVTFDLFEKIDVNGPQAAPLYQELTAVDAAPKGSGPIGWNFEKFVIGKDGKVVGRFATRTKPDAKEVVQAIDTALAK